MSTYSKINHAMYEHPKIVGLSDRAFRAYVESILYSGKHLTDGFLDERIVLRMWGAEAAAELCENDVNNPSWVRVTGGWQIYGYAERQTSRAQVDAQREQKRSAAHSRWNAQRMHSASTVHSTTHAQAMPDIDIDTDVDIDKQKITNKSPYSEDFEKFWKSYPRRLAKGDAWKAWCQLRKEKLLPSVDVLTVAAESYGRRNHDPEYQKYPAGWLRQHRWLDEADAPKRGGSMHDQPKGDKPAWKAVVADPWLG